MLSEQFLKITVVYATAKILNWKQFTTHDAWIWKCNCCLCYCKDTKLKAIHNQSELSGWTVSVVYATAKILNWKQFTTHTVFFAKIFCCLCYCKDTKLKAIHNWILICNSIKIVVYATAKILNWKQFTT